MMCLCVRCGPPWRETVPKPPPEASVVERLSWSSWMYTCPRCGSKRCPGSIDHDRPCATEDDQ